MKDTDLKGLQYMSTQLLHCQYFKDTIQYSNEHLQRSKAEAPKNSLSTNIHAMSCT